MAGLIANYEGEGLVGQGDAFLTIARAIVAQQISVRAADSIWARLEACVGTVAPREVAARSQEELRGAGLTRQKSGYLCDIAIGFVSGDIDPGRWQEADDDAVTGELLALRGVGRWTAEMVLIFHLQRPDVLPLADIGVRPRHGQTLRRRRLDGTGGDSRHTPRVGGRGARWRSWHLWRSLDPLPVAY